MKLNMYDYIKKESITCIKILENRSARLEAFIELIKTETSIKRLIFLATGSSVNAVYCAKYYIEEVTGLEVLIKIPLLFAQYDKVIPEDALVIGVSQSGSSFSTIEALKSAKTKGIKHTVALTGKVTSPIAVASDIAIDIGCGDETVGFVTMGFSATIFVLMLMGVEAAYATNRINSERYELEIKKLSAAAYKIDDVIERTDKWYAANAREFIEGERFIAIAYGPNYGAAMEGYTKLTETIKCPTNAFELEEYLHGPNLELKDNHFMFFLQGKGMLEERLFTLKSFVTKITEHTFTISHKDTSEDRRVLALGYNGDENISPLLFVIPFQVLCFRLSIDKGINLEKDLFKEFTQAINIKVDN